MMWIPKNAWTILSGKLGESVFNKPSHLRPSEIEQLPVFLTKIVSTADHRAIALIAAMVLENYLDQLLSALMPRYNRLEKSDDFTLASKLALLEALKLIPPHITECADVVRKIRNSFAHDLDIDAFAKTKQWSHIEELCKQLFDKDELKGKSELDRFWGISYVAIVGVKLYVTNAEGLRSRLDDPRLASEIERERSEQVQKFLGEQTTLATTPKED